MSDLSDTAQLLSLAARLASKPATGDLATARMAAAEVCRRDGWGDLADAYLRGAFDEDDEIQVALAALRIGRAMDKGEAA